MVQKIKAVLGTAKGPAYAIPAIFNVPAKSEQKYPKPGTKRDRVIRALRTGVVVGGKGLPGLVILIEDWKTDRIARECLTILRRTYGFGFTYDAETDTLRILEA